jgi:hypothetical protein
MASYRRSGAKHYGKGGTRRKATPPERTGRDLDKAWAHCLAVKSLFRQGLATEAELEQAIESLREAQKKAGARLFDPAVLLAP